MPYFPIQKHSVGPHKTISADIPKEYYTFSKHTIYAKAFKHIYIHDFSVDEVC